MLEKLLKDKQIAASVCNQFGDTGKGKIADVFAPWADVIAKGTGGPNSGNTVVLNSIEYIFHSVPAGIFYDSHGKVNITGNGTVVDLKSYNGELDNLEKNGMSYNNLMISKDANVIMPYHIIEDCATNKSQKGGGIGSTGRGIGPCYADKIARRGITISNLFDRDILSTKIDKIKEFYPNQKINTDEIIEEMTPYAERISPLVRDTVTEMHNFVRNGKKIFLEGSQGLLLSIEHGTYPFVTSSDCSINGLASGVGISAGQIDLPLGIIKFPFMTRVGGGPFPTELGGKQSELYCGNEGDIFYEVKNYLGMNLNLDEIKRLKDAKDFAGIKEYKKQACNYIKSNKSKIVEMINSPDNFLSGVGVRLLAGEYGATTGRPRRVGWTDAVMGRYAVEINGPLFILTKPDCLGDAESFNICYGYDIFGEKHEEFNKEEEYLREVRPILKTYEGYGDISDIKEFDKLPPSLKLSIKDFEKFTGGMVKLVSVGPERNQTIVR
ncbi:MAG: adenylosuccinate synthetase [Nanobdellota archaeon]